MKVYLLDDWFDTLRALPSFAKLAPLDVNIWTDHTKDTDGLATRLAHAEADGPFRERIQVMAGLLAGLPNLRLTAFTVNTVLPCSNMHCNSRSVAATELTWALILACASQLNNASIKSDSLQMGVGQTLVGRTLGLFGYGRIAKALFGYAHAFGMPVVWWASEEGRTRALADGETLASSRASSFADRDFASVHVRLKPETCGIITVSDLAGMKQTASLINTSRTKLVQAGAPNHMINSSVWSGG